MINPDAGPSIFEAMAVCAIVGAMFVCIIATIGALMDLWSPADSIKSLFGIFKCRHSYKENESLQYIYCSNCGNIKKTQMTMDDYSRLGKSLDLNVRILMNDIQQMRLSDEQRKMIISSLVDQAYEQFTQKYGDVLPNDIDYLFRTVGEVATNARAKYESLSDAELMSMVLGDSSIELTLNSTTDEEWLTAPLTAEEVEKSEKASADYRDGYVRSWDDGYGSTDND